MSHPSRRGRPSAVGGVLGRTLAEKTVGKLGSTPPAGAEEARSTVRIDLHAHSSRSDGTDDPDTLLDHAARAGLDIVALTDHDTYAGWELARQAAQRLGIGLIPGVEISCRFAGRGMHLLAYLPDAGYEPLSEELAQIRASRDHRVPQVVEQLVRHGLEVTVKDIVDGAKDATSLGRPHIADALVRRGHVADRREAFDRWLAEGRPGYVAKYAPSPGEVIPLVLAAGGVPVLAHPRGRASRVVVDDAAVAELAELGLAGLEVDHSDHDASTRQDLRSLAGALDLIVTGSSDHHGTGKIGHALGCETTAPEQFERLLDRGRLNAAAVGRGTQPVLSPEWRAS